MNKQGRMKKITVLSCLALGVAFGVFSTDGSAMAGYLATPSVSLSNNGGFEFSVTSSTGTVSAYDLNSSTYGTTIPTPAALSAAGVHGTIESIQGTAGTTFYDPSSLGLNQIATLTEGYNGTASNGSAFSGNVISNVFEVTKGGPVGDLVFTYQFDVTSTSPPENSINGLSVSFFNEPLNLVSGIGTNWTLGDGINSTPVGTYFSPITTPTAPVDGTVNYDIIDGTVYSLAYSSSAIFAGDVSPQVFVASNATAYTLGSLSFLGGGAGLPGIPVFVPSTPEPSTLVLLATGLGILAFMARRKNQGRVTI